MKAFRALVFDDVLDSSTPLYISPDFSDQLGAMEQLSIFGVAIALSGTGPTLSVQVEESPDQIHWQNKQSSPEINAAAISLSTFTDVQGRDAGALPSSGFVRLRLEVGGTSPRVHVKLWVALSAAWPSSFSPSDLPGLIAWFDLQDPTSYTEAGGFITSITNKASGVAWTTAASVHPGLSLTGLNGLPCMSFNGSSQAMESTEAAVVAAFADSVERTTYAVAKSDIADRQGVILGFGDSGAATASSGGDGTNNTGAGRWSTFHRDAADTIVNIDSSSASPTDTNPHVLSYVHTATALSIRVDNGAPDPSGASAAYGTTTPDQVAIGALDRPTPVLRWDGVIGEILLYSVAHDSVALDQVSAYLKAKWGTP